MGGEREAQERADIYMCVCMCVCVYIYIYIIMTDLCCFMAETNTTL